MEEGFDKPFLHVPISCLDYFRSNPNGESSKGDLHNLLSKNLTAALSGAAKLHQAFYDGWTADGDHPGYLMKIDPPMTIRVPFHVLPVFADKNQLTDLWSISRIIRSTADSTICLSGSNVLRGMFGTVGDVDYCEYVPFNQQFSASKILKAIEGDNDVICLSVSLGKRKWPLPMMNGKPTEDEVRSALESNHLLGANIQFEYVASTRTFGVLEVTNKIIAIGAGGSSAALKQTFAAQEAPLVPIDWLPNHMNEPFELGRYIDWLLNSIVNLKDEKKYLKCLKRCTSLSRILFLPEVSNAINCLLSEHKDVNLNAQMHALEELRDRVVKIQDSRAAKLLVRIETEIGNCSRSRTLFLTNPHSEGQQFAEKAHTVIDDLLFRAKI